MNLCLNAFVIQFLDGLLDTCSVTDRRALLLPYAHRGHCKDEDRDKDCSTGKQVKSENSSYTAPINFSTRLMSRALDSGNSPGGRSPYLPNVTSAMFYKSPVYASPARRHAWVARAKPTSAGRATIVNSPMRINRLNFKIRRHEGRRDAVLTMMAKL